MTPPRQGVLTRQSSFRGPGEALGRTREVQGAGQCILGLPLSLRLQSRKRDLHIQQFSKWLNGESPLRARKGLTSQPMGIYSHLMDRTEKDATSSSACTHAHVHTCTLTRTSRYTPAATSAAP